MRTRKLATWQWLAMAAALCSAPVIRAADKGTDAGGYTATDSAVYSFIDLVGGGGSASVLAGTDDGVALVTLPFPFQFYGKSYTLVCTSANGLLTFVTSAAECAPSVDFANTDVTSTALPGDAPAVMPFWTDLTFQVSGGGAVYYQTQGAAGSRRFVLEWSNAYPQGSGNPVTFEAILYEGSNKVLFQYQTVDLGAGNPAARGGLATVGIRDTGGNSNNRQIAWSYNAAVLGNSTAIQFTPPAGAQTSVNTITTAPPGLPVTIDGTSFTTPKVVSWTPNTSHTLAVISPQTNGGTRYTLTGWSSGGSTPQVTVQAPPTGTTFTATFRTDYQLTTGTNPANVGSVSGAGWYAAGSIAAVTATVPANYQLAAFSGDLRGVSNPQNLTMDGPKNVVANFQSTAAPVLNAAVTGKADGATAGQRVWTIRLANTGLGTATGAQISAVTPSRDSGHNRTGHEFDGPGDAELLGVSGHHGTLLPESKLHGEQRRVLRIDDHK
ncbi:MAG: hypothetical protein NTW28_18715 [Candidatus Solibacter sp.]|nr:hypothetical protein [Candidatus Solibacter sp.]